MAEGHDSPLPTPSSTATPRKGLTSGFLQVGLGGIALGAIFFATHFFPVMRMLTAANDSPGEVVGGSIVLTGYDNSVQTSNYPYLCATKEYPLRYCMTTSQGSSMLDFDKVGNFKAVVIRTGWRLHLSNSDRSSNEVHDALLVTSASDPVTLSPGDGTTIYIWPRIRSNMNDPSVTEWLGDPRKPHFHDFYNSSMGKGKEDPKVDLIVNVTLETSNSSLTQPCNPTKDGKHVCTIYIGARTFRQTVVSVLHHAGR